MTFWPFMSYVIKNVFIKLSNTQAIKQRKWCATTHTTLKGKLAEEQKKTEQHKEKVYVMWFMEKR